MTSPIVISAIAEEADFAGIRARVRDWLDEHSQAAGVVFAEQAFALAAERDGRTLGGLIGSTNLGWLHVSLLAVAPEARRLGIGRRLLAAAEELARRRGCHGAWLNTFEHQGAGFYPRLGWEEFGALEEFPRGGVRRFYRKAL